MTIRPLQDGIYHAPGKTPPDHFRFATFNFAAGTTNRQAADALARIWSMLQGLCRGEVPDLAATRPDDPQIVVDAGELTTLLAFGPSLFDRGIAGAGAGPADLRPFDTSDDGPFPGLKWAANAEREVGQADFAIQLVGKSQLSVVRPLVEIQKVIDDHQLPITMPRFHSGIHRDDGRSWIDFHDGVNNLKSSERQNIIQIRQNPEPWLVGGTYLAFMKLAVDLVAWRKLARVEQEAIVGRDKISGCPIRSALVDANGTITLERDPALPPNTEISRAALSSIIDPPPNPDAIVQQSHIFRANRTRQITPAANRIYRQGYEFVDSPPEGGLRVGLNFVSFQGALEAVTRILETEGWMGDVNFGGTVDAIPPALALISVVSGGFFAVPPQGDPFPGADIFA